MPRIFRRQGRRVLIDVDTQKVFLDRCGSRQVPLLRSIRRMMAWARLNHVPVVSTMLNGSERSGCPIDPVIYQKHRYSLLSSHVLYNSKNSLDLPRGIFRSYQQVIFMRNIPDPFTHSRAERLLSELTFDDYLVLGMGLESAVLPMVLGLLHRGKHVTVVVDAVEGALDHRNTLALRKCMAKGATLTTTEQLTGPPPAHRSTPTADHPHAAEA